MATIDQPKFRPSEIPICPTASVASWAFPWNQTGNRCHTLPNRSAIGT